MAAVLDYTGLVAESNENDNVSSAPGLVVTGVPLATLFATGIAPGDAVIRVRNVLSLGGLALGVGGVLRSADAASEVRLRGAAATATTLFTGGAGVTARRGA